jgi:CBS domain-containing protein
LRRKAMLVRTLLETKEREIARVGPEATVAEAADLLVSKNANMVVVTEGFGMLLGVVTTSDVNRSVANCSGHQHACATAVREMMTRDVITCGFGDHVEHVWSLMKERGLRSFPVVDETGNLAGLIERRDILVSLYEEAKLLVVVKAPRMEGAKRSTEHKWGPIAVAENMSRDVVCVGPDVPVSDVAKLMRDERVGCIPVKDHDTVVGIVTDRDITCRVTAAGHAGTSTSAEDVMTRDVAFCR